MMWAPGAVSDAQTGVPMRCDHLTRPCTAFLFGRRIITYFSFVNADNISPEQFQRYREVEQKHGRIAMIATIGYVVPEKFGTFGDIKLGGDVKFSDVPNGVQALFKIPALGLLQILLLIGILETQFPNVQGDYGTGYFGQSLEEPLKSRKLAIELSNGRLAMLSIMGLLAQDVVSQGAPFDGPQFETGTFQAL